MMPVIRVVFIVILIALIDRKSTESGIVNVVIMRTFLVVVSTESFVELAIVIYVICCLSVIIVFWRWDFGYVSFENIF